MLPARARRRWRGFVRRDNRQAARTDRFHRRRETSNAKHVHRACRTWSITTAIDSSGSTSKTRQLRRIARGTRRADQTFDSQCRIDDSRRVAADSCEFSKPSVRVHTHEPLRPGRLARWCRFWTLPGVTRCRPVPAPRFGAGILRVGDSDWHPAQAIVEARLRANRPPVV